MKEEFKKISLDALKDLGINIVRMIGEKIVDVTTQMKNNKDKQ